jgi:pimeloyl-ACP methyl ester carboxylesterase
MPDTGRPIPVNVTPRGLELDRPRLARTLAGLAEGAPVVALIHGWRYAPGGRADCPHGSIMALDPKVPSPRVISWPRHLGLDGKNGLAIALGWPARCGPWRAHGRARAAAAGLAEVAAAVAEMAPGRQLHVIAHSMGARVALLALSRMPAGRIGRLVLLAAAESRATAAAAMATPAGRTAEVINVGTRENDLFDACFEWGVHLGLSASVGRGFGSAAPEGWRDLWIDQPETRAGLMRLGYPVAAPDRRICHWSPYLRRGLLPLYRALVDGTLDPGLLPQVKPARRWSRLLTRDPFGGGAGLPA